MSIAERLGEMDLSTASASQEVKGPKGTASLQTDSFAVLLVQGLESHDATILNVRVQCFFFFFYFIFKLVLILKGFKMIEQTPEAKVVFN